MKIIIEQDCVKREIVGPFAICISEQDRQTLIRCLSETDREWCSGWITICEKAIVKTGTSTVPLAWTDERIVNPPSSL